VIWGSFMVVVGCLLLLERMGNFHIPSGTAWPMMLFTVSVTQVAEKRFGSALMFMILAVVFLACTIGWFGLTYAKSWPLMVVAAGVGIIVNTLTRSSRTLGFELREPGKSDHESSGS
jgi:hypothetical protein